VESVLLETAEVFEKDRKEDRQVLRGRLRATLEDRTVMSLKKCNDAELKTEKTATHDSFAEVCVREADTPQVGR
jgi:hypothetical protein